MEEERITVKKEDIILGFVCLILGYFFVMNTFFTTQFDQHYQGYAYEDGMRLSSGLGMFLFTCIFVIVVNLYAWKKQRKATKESNVWMVLLLLQGLGFFLLARPSLSVYPLFGLFLTAIYWTVCRFQLLTVGKTSDYVIYDLLVGLFRYPFQYFFYIGRVLTSTFKQKKAGKTVTQVLLGLLFGIPIVIIFYNLLCEVDEGFSSILSIDQWLNLAFENRILTIVKIILTIPVASYMFGLIYGMAVEQWEDKKKNPIVEITGRCGFMSMPTITTILTMVIVLYTMFFAVQAGYLFSAFENRLPEHYTYAEYARRGFFELCAICVLNLILLFFAHIICREANKKLLKIFTLILYGFTALFVAIAFRKMLLYITTYGLTQKRMLTCWFMIFVVVLLVIGILREFYHFPMLRYAAYAAMFLFTACCLSNMDGMIATNNGWLYENGKIKTPDYSTLTECGIVALPIVNELINHETDPEIKENLEKVKCLIQENYNGDTSTWREIVIQDLIIDAKVGEK